MEPNLDDSHFGWRKHRSTAHAVIALLHSHTVMASLDSGGRRSLPLCVGWLNEYQLSGSVTINGDGRSSFPAAYRRACGGAEVHCLCHDDSTINIVMLSRTVIIIIIIVIVIVA